MAINERIKLTWKGKEYSVLMTMRFIEEIEEHLNLSTMVVNCNTDDMKISHACRLIALILQKGGCEVTIDDIWEGIFKSGEIEPKDVVSMVSIILGAAFPSPKKKPDSSSKKPTSSKAKAKKKTSTRGKSNIS